MKKIILFLAVAFIFTKTNAQDFVLNPRVLNTSVSNNAAFEVSAYIKNNTDATDSIFKWAVLEKNFPSQWDLETICSPQDCYYGPFTIGNYTNFKLKKGAQSSFIVGVDPTQTGGNGTVKIIVRGNANPNNVDTLTVNINAWMTGLNDISDAHNINSYPNPVKDQLNIKYASNGAITVDIYNILGVKVKSFMHDGNVSQVNVSDLQNGVYFIRLKGTAGATYSKSFTKSE